MLKVKLYNREFMFTNYTTHELICMKDDPQTNCWTIPFSLFRMTCVLFGNVDGMKLSQEHFKLQRTQKREEENKHYVACYILKESRVK